MKLGQFIQALQRLLELYGDQQVIYSSDADGNNFSTMDFAPTEGFYDNEEGDFYPTSSEDFDDEMRVNAVCVN
jgi:hypothetical protein